jgi:hypothetical protein
MKVPALTGKGFDKLHDLRAREGHGTPGGAVKCVEIWKNTEGEGSVLARF